MEFFYRNVPSEQYVTNNGLSYAFKAYNEAAPFTICSLFAKCSDQLGRYGHLKKKETKLIGAYRSRVSNLDKSELNLKTVRGRKSFSIFKQAQSMAKIVKAFSNEEADDDNEAMSHVMKKILSKRGEKMISQGDEKSEEDIDGLEEETAVKCYFERLLKQIFQDNPLTSEECDQVESLQRDAKVASVATVVKTVAEALNFLDPKNLMGAIVTSMNATYSPEPTTIESARRFFLTAPETQDT